MPSSRSSSGVTIRTDQVPELRRPLPVLRTDPASSRASEYVIGLTRRLAPHAEHRQLADDGAVGVYDGDRLIAYTNPTTGDSHVVPLLDGLEQHRSLTTVGRRGARQLLAEESQLFADDVSRALPSKPVQLLASHHTQRGTTTTPAAVLSTVQLRRQVGSVPVFGVGSSSSVSFSRNGIEGFNHRWTPASPTGERIESHAQRTVVDRIVEHLGTLPDTQAVTVEDVRTAYYDDGRGTLQPVYRYRVSVPATDGRTAPGMLVGYVPIGDRVGDLPDLFPVNKVTPRTPGKTVRTRATYDGTSVGRYVVRNDNAGWVASANSFWDSLVSASAQVPGGPSFQDAQYFWAEPRLFLDQKDWFVNAVNIALTEVHGNWGLFTTLQNNADYVELTDIPDTGYGAGGHATLAYWILHSCEVIPTQTDETTSFDVWWNIFNGLHAALGYRTEMWINDQISTQFGTLVGLGAPVVSSWLNTVINDNDYTNVPSNWYDDGNRMIREPMGRPSAVAVAGHGDDTAMMVDQLPRPSTLTEWWYDN